MRLLQNPAFAQTAQQPKGPRKKGMQSLYSLLRFLYTVSHISQARFRLLLIRSRRSHLPQGTQRLHTQDMEKTTS
jgi:hypothetical protein